LVQVLLLIVEGPAATVADGENRRLRGMAMEEHVEEEEEEEPQDHSATASSLRHCYTIPTAHLMGTLFRHSTEGKLSREKKIE
jgi:hypothetical protein